jgi:hypothetical protein
VNGSSNAVVNKGATLTIGISNGPGNRADWVALAAAGSSDMGVVAWVYLSGSQQTLPDVGMKSASVTLPAPTTAGSYEARLYANGGWTVVVRTGFTVTASSAPPPPPPPPPAAAQPVITVNPETPFIPDTTPLGAVVATYTVSMSDGTPFTGTVRFGAPSYDAGGIFALSGDKIVVSPSGPGVGPNMSSITDQVTLEAIP